MPRAIQEMIKRFSRDPAWIRIEPHAQNAPQVEQIYFEVDRRSKIEALTRLIDCNDFRFGIIFCSTKLMVDDLDEHLHARGYAVDRLHGDITQAQRNRVMAKFRERKFEFLIATDVAARGLDVDDLEVVFNFDLPNDAEDYTHRIGRTGRAGRSGQAFTFVSGQEIYRLQSMIRFAKLKIRRGTIPSLDEVEEARSSALYEKIRATLDAKDFRPRDAMVDRLLEQGFASTDICSALIHLLQQAEGGAGPAKNKPSGDGSAPRLPAGAPSGPMPRRTEDRVPTLPKAPAPAERFDDEADDEGTTKKQKYDRPARTGREQGMATVFLNVGRKQLITPADVVGKIAGVTRLPANVVGAIDIHQRHTLVDVAEDQAATVVEKLKGIRIKGISLEPTLAREAAE
jgi:ATP-dependent RNA helicase DeaD